MKNKWIFGITVFLVFGFVSVGCGVQSSKEEQNLASTSNTEAQLVGTWVEQIVGREGGKWVYKEGARVVLNSDGTGSIGENILRYAASSGKMVVVLRGGSVSREYYFTDGGNTLILWSPGIPIGEGLDGNIYKKEP